MHASVNWRPALWLVGTLLLLVLLAQLSGGEVGPRRAGAAPQITATLRPTATNSITMSVSPSSTGPRVGEFLTIKVDSNIGGATYTLTINQDGSNPVIGPTPPNPGQIQ